MSFSPAQLQQQLAHLPASRCYWVAYSGGCDSHVLLHALLQIQQQFSDSEIRAIHINHGLSPKADEWAQHCVQTCQELAIPLHSISVNAQAEKGEGPEAAARQARYRAFKETISEGDVLLLAHHQDDQAETLLLQLFRGSGPQGLSAMPKCRKFANGWLCRPLLDFSRDDLCNYARSNHLKWIDDPSNFDTSYDRNYLRQDILPSIKTRWPGIDATLARAARHQAEVLELTQQLAQRDWEHCRTAQSAQILITPLLKLSTAEQNNLLRYWIKDINHFQVPDQQRMQRILLELIDAAEDAQPLIEWGNIQLRRYQENLYLLNKEELTLITPDGSCCDLSSPVPLTVNKQLTFERVPGKGLKSSLRGKEIQLRYRRGGETCRPLGRGHNMSLKNLMQEWSIPPWLRPLVPLIYVGDEIAAVADYCVCESFAADKNEEGIKIMLKTIT